MAYRPGMDDSSEESWSQWKKVNPFQKHTLPKYCLARVGIQKHGIVFLR